MFTVPIDSNSEQATLDSLTPETITSAFKSACAKRGLSLPTDLITDGDFHRFSTKAGNASDRAGYYT